MEEGDPASLQLWPGKPDDGVSGGGVDAQR